jgi:hypothetical protein
MPDGILDLIKAGGRAAGPLAVASWGGYFLPLAANYPPPFNVLAPWLCFGTMTIGAVSASIIVFRAALAH